MMESLYLLIPLSLAGVVLIAVVFWYALQSGQFDDLDRPAVALLHDDASVSPHDSKTSSDQQT
jgi:cbb3-type cytochrome oxidase maturation protein